MCFRVTLAAVSMLLLSTCSAVSAATSPLVLSTQQGTNAPIYYVEISISGNRLTLFEESNNGDRVPVAEYTVGSAVRGLDTYPLGLGKVTSIQLNPWWYPTPYSRQVFRGRGIELPAKVPPGHPLNYMGPFKIVLSHKTWKGAIYRIHGNNNPRRVGRRVTGGCFVMDNADGLELAHKIRVGTEVNILP